MSTDGKKGVYVAVLEFLFIGVGLGLLFMSPHRLGGDGLVRYMALSKLLEGGEMADTKYSMVGPLFSTVLYFLGKLYKSSEWWCSRYNFFLFALGLLAIYQILRKHYDGVFLRRLLLILIFGSMFPHHQLKYYGEVFTAVLVGVGILALNYGHSVIGWTSIVLGVVNTPASLVGLGIIVLVSVIRTKKLKYAGILAVAVGLTIAESWIRRGGPLDSGYVGDVGFSTILPYSGKPGFSYPFVFGLISILFSFGKGVLWYCPGLLAPVKKDMPGMTEKFHRSYTLWIGFLIGLVLVYAKWWAWYGGYFWGPRLLLFASIPASFAIALNLGSNSKSIGLNLFVLIALFWSIWVGVSGVVFGQKNMEACYLDNYALEALCWYVPSFSALFRPFVVHVQLTPKDTFHIAFSALVFAYLALPVIFRLINSMATKYAAATNGKWAAARWRL